MMVDDFTQVQEGAEKEIARKISQERRQPPAKVPGYQLERCLGEGAYGEVWVATDVNNPGRQVAIKFYTRRGGDWTLLAREVEKLNFLATDRYIVQLLDVGWNAAPPYYVMEFMEQGSLAEWQAAKGPRPVSEVVALFQEVVVGVVNAHNRGVLHCDLKPANVLLGHDGKPRLADFGQSRVSQDQTPALGTLFYMAPEQADLKAAPDARWDVYALGALLYCLLTGEPPHQDATGAGTLKESVSLEDRLVRYRRLLQESRPPRRHRRVPGIDRGLIEIIDRCLAVNPAKRYANAQAILNALQLRSLRRARRPLLVLGAVGPILLLLVMGYFIQTSLVTAVEDSKNALTEASRVSNEFAAQAAAAKVAGKIDRRWRILEQEAADPGFQQLLIAARGASFGTPAQRALQDRLKQLYEAHPEASAQGWAVFDDQGRFLARAPLSNNTQKNIGKSFAHRNFFSGLDRDLEPNEPAPPPLSQVHRSNVIDSSVTGTRMVAFSVPIWQGKPTSSTHPRLGVLMMTVDVGSFVELSSPEGVGNDVIAVLVDRRKGSGTILEHPHLAQLRKQIPKVPEKEMEFSVNVQQFERDWNPDYTDPVGAADADYAGRWLAASAPVEIDGRPGAGDTGWVVVVQQRYNAVIGPVLQLETHMLTRGWRALGLAVAVVTVLWGFVIIVLNESVSSRLLTFLKRRAGLASDSLASLKSSARGPARDRSSVDPKGPTEIERPPDIKPTS